MKDNPLKVIRNHEQFEELCCVLAQFKYGDFDAQRYGRSGQKQWGVDIRATYKKLNNERIVIQCKFKTKPPKFKSNSKTEIKVIKNEIETELAEAVKGLPFDYFIYASNIPRDTNIQKFADSLCTLDYNVILWSQDDITEDIYRYERLKHFYTLNGIKHGVEIINTDFIDTLYTEEEISNPNIFRYYTSSENNNNQWYGVLKNWDVIRNNNFNFLESITDSFNNEYIESKVGGIIIGEGGSGKSVFLRRIAIEICRKQKDIVIWWVTDLHSFYSRDINTIDDNPHYKHLIIIEDWYRNVGNDYSYSKPIFRWLKKKSNVRVVIGDRVINNSYRTQVTKRNKFLISLDENFMILETIIEKLPALKNNITKLLSNEILVSSSPIFIILFVLSELSENEVEVDYDELNFENIFKDLIGKKIFALEEDIRYKGMGVGLYISALLYSDINSNYFSISENGFLIMSQFLGKNKKISKRIKANKEYPKQCSSLVRVEELIFKSGFQFKRLRFNHDLIAEKGISLIQETKYKLDFNFDRYEVERLIDLCLNHNESNVALTLFLWLNNNVNDIYPSNFFQKFEGKFEHLSGSGITIYLQSLAEKEKSVFTEKILKQKDFFKLPDSIVSHALRICQNEQLGKDKAKEILNLFVNNKSINTFLIFNSIRCYCIQKSKEEIIEEVYIKISSLRNEKKFGRLYFDLLYLPLFHIKRHHERVLNIIKTYAYDCTINQKRQLGTIFNCFKEYPDGHSDYFNKLELLCITNLNWLQDLKHQKKINPTKIIDLHIALSISNIRSKAESKKISKKIIKYCTNDTLLTQQTLFKTASEILINEDFEFWT